MGFDCAKYRKPRYFLLGKKVRYCFWLLIMRCFSGCAGIDLDTTNTGGVTLEGTWLIDFTASDSLLDARLTGESAGSGLRSRGRRGQLQARAGGSGLAFVAHDFHILNADKLVVEQNPDSMGVNYQPGVYRDISWGERRRGLWTVNAGWQERTLVIISEADDLRVEERFDRQGDRLVVKVVVEADNKETILNRFFRLMQ